MLNVCWIVFGIVVGAATLGLMITFFTNRDVFLHDLYYYLVVPTIGLSAVNLLAEMMMRYMPSYDYIIVLAYVGITTTLILIFPMFEGIQNVLFIPILGSAFYFDPKRVVRTCVVTSVIAVLLLMMNPTLQETTDVFDLILTISIFVCCTVMALGIMTRGTELMERLRKSLEEKQQLQVQNILNDHLSKIDALTGLYNHKTFHEYMDRLVEQNRTNPVPVCLAVMDVDNFKSVNDTYGHWAGDILLREIAAIMKRSVSANDPCFRPGGEEFATLFIDHGCDSVFEMAERIRREIGELNIPELQGRKITISIGLSRYEKGMDKYHWYNRADQCLYEAKRSGKDKVVATLELN